MKLITLAIAALLNSSYLQATDIESQNTDIRSIPRFHIAHVKAELKPYLGLPISDLLNQAINHKDPLACKMLIRKKHYGLLPPNINCSKISWQQLITKTNVKDLTNQEMYIMIKTFPSTALLPGFYQEIKERAKQGNATAQYNLGTIYYYGQNGFKEKNSEKAHKWYKKSAEQGHPMAQTELGWMYHASKQYKKAYDYFIQAANQGHILTQYNLGIMY